jgi:hypothetical protein
VKFVHTTSGGYSMMPQPPSEWAVPFFFVVLAFAIVQMVRRRLPVAKESRNAILSHIVFGAGISLTGFVLLLATIVVHGPLEAYLLSVATLAGGALYVARGLANLD